MVTNGLHSTCNVNLVQLLLLPKVDDTKIKFSINLIGSLTKRIKAIFYHINKSNATCLHLLYSIKYTLIETDKIQ